MGRATLALSLPLAAAAAATAGCAEAPSPLDPHTPAAARIAELGWFMIAAATVVCLAVFAALGTALATGQRDADAALPAAEDPGGSRTVVIAGMVLPAVVITATLGYTVYVLREVAGAGGPGGLHAVHAEHVPGSAAAAQQRAGATGGEPALAVHLVGHQWWWEIVYPSEQVVTANEIHVPAGTPIRLTVTSEDVIHSFWVPQVAGKVDVIPAKLNGVTFRVDQPGVYRGTCAEFCGVQHAHMHFRLFVDPPAEFAAWLAGQRRVAPVPAASIVAQGQRTFMAAGCAQCHTVRGTGVTGTRGPDLTHVASRRTLGAGTHANTPETLRDWIARPQAMKPGNKMPNPDLGDGEVNAVAAYLESLE